MTKYLILKLKPGKRGVWEAWCKEVMEQHYEETVNTLPEENLKREACFILQNDYVIYLHEAVDKKGKLPPNLENPLNKKHFEVFNECLERVDKNSVIGYDLIVQ